MSVRSAQAITTEFTTRNPYTFQAVNADSLPTGTLYVNGTANGATVTVTNISTGIYKAAVTLPTLTLNDVVAIVISATVTSVSDNAKIWEDTKDVFAGAIPDVAAAANGGLPTVNASNQVAGVSGNVVGSVASVVGAVGSVTGAVGSVTGAVGSVTGAVGSVTGNVGGNVVGSVASVAGAVGSVTGNVGGNVTGSVGSVTGLTVANLDVAVSTRLASGSYTAPDNATIATGASAAVSAAVSAASADSKASANNTILASASYGNAALKTALDTLEDYVDTEVAAIKAKTDNLPGSPAAVGSAMTLTSGERTSIATALLTLDLSTVTGEAARSVLNAVRFLRNKWSILLGVLTVTKEDDTTAAWTASVTTDSSAQPITGNDPS